MRVECREDTGDGLFHESFVIQRIDIPRIEVVENCSNFSFWYSALWEALPPFGDCAAAQNGSASSSSIVALFIVMNYRIGTTALSRSFEHMPYRCGEQDRHRAELGGLSAGTWMLLHGAVTD